VYSLEFPDIDVQNEFATVGKPVSGLDVRVMDELDNVQGAGSPGEVQLRGPIVFRRYYNNPEATRSAFTSDGWFRTGDLGRIDEGRLSILARIKDSIIVSGVNYFGHELEAQLQQLQGIERSFAVAFPTRPKGADTEQLVVGFATSLAPDDDEGLYQLVVAVRNTTIMLWGFRPAVILPLPKSAFPKTSLGKIQRSLMRKRFEAGEFAAHEAHIAEVIKRQSGEYVCPTGPGEIELSHVYAEILGTKPETLSANANFFALGGTSLDILKLTMEVSRRFNVDINLTSILQYPTLRSLAGRITSQSTGDNIAYDPIVPMQLTGKKTPLFCVHPGNGGILIFVNLAKYFANDRPFYALRPRGFNKGEECFRTFEEMTEAYLSGIRKYQSHGPYALAGYSVGCPIAFEIAKKLESLGERVAFLGCIDEGPSENWPPTDLAGCAITVAWLLSLIDLQLAERLRTQIRETEVKDPCEFVFQFARPERLRELDLDLEKFSRWAAVNQSNHTLARATNVSSGSVDSMTVFCSSGWPESMPSDEWCNHLQRWSQFTRKSFRHIQVSGHHIEVMDSRHVTTFQATLRAEIDRAMEA